LLDHYAVERTIADRHVLEVSDEVHRAIVDIADAVRQGREVAAENVDPVVAALQRNARAMIDVDYAGSPLVNDYAESGAGMAEPHPGQRYPDWTGSAGRLITCLFLDLSRKPRRWQDWAAGGQSAWRPLTIPLSDPCAPASERAAWS
jgi:hypothetical protein